MMGQTIFRTALKMSKWVKKPSLNIPIQQHAESFPAEPSFRDQTLAQRRSKLSTLFLEAVAWANIAVEAC
tara:strand:+ start:158 stop:367 length:210 start_codon:yes stop_codon:yes gene_type:complete